MLIMQWSTLLDLRHCLLSRFIVLFNLEFVITGGACIGPLRIFKMEKCVICNDDIKPMLHPETGKVYWDQGHNAFPIAEGRCCDPCNWGLVIPVRIKKWKKDGIASIE